MIMVKIEINRFENIKSLISFFSFVYSLYNKLELLTFNMTSDKEEIDGILGKLISKLQMHASPLKKLESSFIETQ